jgi:hypothetical protein|tara:strand:+ start:451 stop:912 length:462 start_codon:yes stop_codon:yes gene_type:complete
MRRIKSAPANLVEMSNNKKQAKTSINRIVIPIMNEKYTIIIQENNKISEKIETNNVFKKYENFKYFKERVKKIGSLTSDIIGDSNILPFEQSAILTTFINYISENVLKKDKLKEIYAFTLQVLVRYLIMMYIHSQLLHDEIGKNIPLIEDIVK